MQMRPSEVLVLLTNYYAVSEIASFSRKSINLDACTFLDYLDTGSITDGKIHNLTRYTDFTKLPSRARKSIIEGDILYSTVRPNNRHFGIIHSDCKDMVVSTGFSVIRADREKVLPDYLYYLLTGNSVIDLLESIAEQSVSTYPSINDSDIGDLEFEIPSLASQQVVVDIINSIDRKICNNEKINDNLQAIAYSKYNHLKRSCVDQVSLSDIAEVCYGKDHKSLSNGSIPVYGSG
ncbi:MAG: restriction endonuclease subunit S, partial [Candidatus Methanomethylophilaceae archaeon]|nr:restriction endonuclease subunit S [Candidatus Methanomethylophilaceae archaeon]